MSQALVVSRIDTLRINSKRYPSLPFPDQCDLIISQLADPRQIVLWRIVKLCSKAGEWRAVLKFEICENLDDEAMVDQLVNDGELIYGRLDGVPDLYVIMPLQTSRRLEVL